MCKGRQVLDCVEDSPFASKRARQGTNLGFSAGRVFTKLSPVPAPVFLQRGQTMLNPHTTLPI